MWVDAETAAQPARATESVSAASTLHAAPGPLAKRAIVEMYMSNLTTAITSTSDYRAD